VGCRARSAGKPRKRDPQGSGLRPVLANLFLHYAFDRWMQLEYADIQFERYAGDAICHCRSEAQALKLRQVLEQRRAECRLQLHPQKTKVAYCDDANRPENYPERCFDFLGYTFRLRSPQNCDGERFVSFLPAVSNKPVRPILSGWVLYLFPRPRFPLNRELTCRCLLPTTCRGSTATRQS
jgi:RNA-directed DNA polymerase